MRRTEHIMGTAFDLDVRDAIPPAAVDAFFAHLVRMDASFSTYRSDRQPLPNLCPASTGPRRGRGNTRAMTSIAQDRPTGPVPTDAKHDHLSELVQDVTARALTAAGLAGIALVHLLDSIGKYGEVRYIFWMYVALMVDSLTVGGAILHHRHRATWLVTAGLAASAVVGYVVNRTVGLPDATDDIGNWTRAARAGFAVPRGHSHRSGHVRLPSRPADRGVETSWFVC
ncbi:MAG: hypothetical protein ACR2J6_02020 [Thermoleophilaceae bacterium]